MSDARIPPILQKLLDEPDRFTYGQAMRLLGLLHAQTPGGPKAFLNEHVAVTPHLSLGFPPSDLVSLRRLEPSMAEKAERPGEPHTPTTHLPHFALTATFLGLYGSASPLPTFYTEELLDDQRDDRNAARDFLDIINTVLYRKYHQAHTLAQLPFRALEQRDVSVATLLFSLLGLGHTPLREAHDADFHDLGSIPLLARHTRSAQGLEEMVGLYLGISNVEVEQCVERTVTIPLDQRCRLGQANATLGQYLPLGSCLRDFGGQFRLHLHDLDRHLFERLLPGQPLRKALDHVIGLYLCDPLEYEIVLHLLEGAATPTRLGDAHWQRLGVDTFLLDPHTPSHETMAAASLNP